jgi:kinesin family protein 18/19
LGDVLHALSSRSKCVVPYRNSKLTMLLQDALGGNTKTVMITCIPQQMRASGEISTALTWSARSRTIQNKVTRNVDSGGDSELAVLSRQVQEFKRNLMQRAKEMEHIEGSNRVQKLCESVPEEAQLLHEALKAVMNGHNMLLEASASKLSGLNDMVKQLNKSTTAAEQQLQEQETTILRLQHALECALAEQRSMRRQSDDQHEYQQQAAKISLLEDALAEAESSRDKLNLATAVVAARDAEIEELKRQLGQKDAELRSRSLQEETVTLVLDKFVQDNMRLQEQLLDAQENSAILASSGSRRSSRSSLSSISSSVRLSLESVSRSSTGRRSSLGGDEEAARPLLQGRMSDVEQAETVIVECKNLDTGCIELVSVNANTSLHSSGKRRRSSEAAEENMMPNGQISPGKMHFLDEAKQVLKIEFCL